MFAGLRNPFVGLPGLASPATATRGTVRVRVIGTPLYNEYAYSVHHDDEHCAERLRQAIRADLSHVDARLIGSAFTLHPRGSPRVCIDTNEQLKRQLNRSANNSLAVVYRVQEGVPAPSAKSLPVYQSAEERERARNASVQSGIDREQQLRTEFARFRAETCEQVASGIDALGASRSDADIERIAREKVSRKHAALGRLGARQPRTLANQIAFDIADAAAKTDQRLIRQNNRARDVYNTSLLNSPLWTHLDRRLQAERVAHRPAVHPAPIRMPQAEPVAEAMDYSAPGASFAVPSYVYVSGVTKPNAVVQTLQKKFVAAPRRLESVGEPVRTLQEKIAAAPMINDDVPEHQGRTLESVGFRAHDSSAYRIGAGAAERQYEFTPLAKTEQGASKMRWKLRSDGDAYLTVRNDYTLVPGPISVYADGQLLGQIEPRQQKTFTLKPGKHTMDYRNGNDTSLFDEDGEQQRMLHPWSYFISINNTIKHQRPLYLSLPMLIAGEPSEAIGAFFGLIKDRQPRLSVTNSFPLDSGDVDVSIDDVIVIKDLKPAQKAVVYLQPGEHKVQYNHGTEKIGEPQTKQFRANWMYGISLSDANPLLAYIEWPFAAASAPLVKSNAPKGVRVSLQIADDPSSETAIGAEFTEVAPGRKNVCVERKGRRVVLPQPVTVMPGQALAFELNESDGQKMRWRVEQINPIEHELVEHFGAQLTQGVPTGKHQALLVLHENGSRILGDAKARQDFLAPSGEEATVHSADGGEYFFDQDRAVMFDGTEVYGHVQGVFAHPREPNTTVVTVGRA